MKEIKLTFQDNGYIAISVKGINNLDLFNALAAIAYKIRTEYPDNKNIDMAITAVVSRRDTMGPQGVQ